MPSVQGLPLGGGWLEARRGRRREASLELSRRQLVYPKRIEPLDDEQDDITNSNCLGMPNSQARHVHDVKLYGGQTHSDESCANSESSKWGLHVDEMRSHMMKNVICYITEWRIQSKFTISHDQAGAGSRSAASGALNSNAGAGRVVNTTTRPSKRRKTQDGGAPNEKEDGSYVCSVLSALLAHANRKFTFPWKEIPAVQNCVIILQRYLRRVFPSSSIAAPEDFHSSRSAPIYIGPLQVRV
jgi:hypothetical protein